MQPGTLTRTLTSLELLAGVGDEGVDEEEKNSSEESLQITQVRFSFPQYSSVDEEQKKRNFRGVDAWTVFQFSSTVHPWWLHYYKTGLRSSLKVPVAIATGTDVSISTGCICSRYF